MKQAGKFKIVLLVLGVCTIIVGVQNLYVTLDNKVATIYDINTYNPVKDSKKWVTFTNGILNFVECSWFESRFTKNIKEAYIPYVSDLDLNDEATAQDAESQEKEPDTIEKPIKVLVYTKDKQLIKFVTEVRAKDSAKEDSNYLTWIVENYDKLYRQQDVSGTIKFGIEDTDSSDKKEIKGLYDNLDDNFVVLELDKKPEEGLWIFMFAIGAVLLFFFFQQLGAGKAKEPTANTPAPPQP
jgi:hypothetical protein